MVTLLVLFGIFLVVAAVGIACAFGAGADSRDPAFSAGRLLYRSQMRP